MDFNTSHIIQFCSEAKLTNCIGCASIELGVIILVQKLINYEFRDASNLLSSEIASLQKQNLSTTGLVIELYNRQPNLKNSSIKYQAENNYMEALVCSTCTSKRRNSQNKAALGFVIRMSDDSIQPH